MSDYVQNKISEFRDAGKLPPAERPYVEIEAVSSPFREHIKRTHEALDDARRQDEWRLNAMRVRIALISRL
jgi:hypothetical protein